MDSRFVALIHAYQAAVAAALAEFRRRSGLADPAARREAGLPRVGTFPGSPCLAYEYHGVGLRLTLGTDSIDFDFGHDGRTDGFDLWRLWLFAQTRPAEFPEFQDRHALELPLKTGVAGGWVRRGAAGHDDGLYYLTELTEPRASIPAPAG